MEVVIFYAITTVIGLVNLGCLVYVLVKMYKAKGILHALFGFFCCTLYPFIWGWVNAKQLKMYDIMIFWTIITIFGTIVYVIYWRLALIQPEILQGLERF